MTDQNESAGQKRRKYPNDRPYRRASGQFFCDLRRFKRKLTPEERKRARHFALDTTNKEEAHRIYRTLVKAIKARADVVEAAEPGAYQPWTLAEYVARYLELRKKDPKVRAGTLKQERDLMLKHAMDFLGRDTLMKKIKTGDVARWVNDGLRQSVTREGTPFSERTCRKYLNVLGVVFKFAAAEDVVPKNVVSDWITLKTGVPLPGRADDRFFECDEAALLLEAARLSRSTGKAAIDSYEIIATFLLTGVRNAEGGGLRIKDVDLSPGGAVYVVENEHRESLKTETSTRRVPVVAQLREIIGPHIARRVAEGAGPEDRLFVKGTRESGAIGDWCRELRRLAALCGFANVDEIVVKMLRKTWASAQLALPNTSKETVRHWGGWSTDAMLNGVYSKPLTVKPVGDVLQFRIEHYACGRLRERLANLYRALGVEPPAAVKAAWLNASVAGATQKSGEVAAGAEGARDAGAVVGAPERTREDHAQISELPSRPGLSMGEGVTKIGYPRASGRGATARRRARRSPVERAAKRGS